MTTKKKVKTKKTSYCRLCRCAINGHANRYYCDKKQCQARYKAIRRKQIAAAKRKLEVTLKRTERKIKQKMRDQ